MLKAGDGGGGLALPFDGGAAVTLTAPGYGNADWAQDAQALYLSIPVESGPLLKVAKSGGVTVLLYSIRPDQIAVDGTAVYFTELPNGASPRLMRALK